MPLAPMWSQLISAEVTTNAAVESHMRVVKKQLLKGRTRLRPGDFVRLLLQDTAARVRADLIPNRSLPRGRTRTTAEVLLHPEQQQQFWAKRNKSQKPIWYDRAKPAERRDHSSGSSSLCRLRRVSVVMVVYTAAVRLFLCCYVVVPSGDVVRPAERVYCAFHIHTFDMPHLAFTLTATSRTL